MKYLILSFLLPLLVTSCGSGSSRKSTASTPPPRKKMEERFGGGGGGRDPEGFQKDSKGNMISKSSKRSPFESKGEASFAKKDFKKEAYKAGDYNKKSWWGNKEYDRKAYAGNTDGSKFQTAAAAQGKNAREATTSVTLPDGYKTGNYATDAAREAGKANIKTGSNALIDNRQKTFEQPEIIGWREQRAMSMQESKGILGR